MGWTSEQDNYIRTSYPNHLISVEDIANYLGKNTSTVRNRASKLGIERGRSNGAINNYIIENYDKESPDSIADRFNISVKSVYCRIARLGLCKEQEFPYSLQTLSMHKEIKNNYATESTFLLSARVGLPVDTIRKIAWRYGVKKQKRKIRRKRRSIRDTWSDYEISFIKDNCHRMTMMEIAKQLKRGYNSVKGKIAHLGLSEYNLKIYNVGKFSFLYINEYEKEEKILYITMYNELLNRRNGDYASRENKKCS